MRPAPAVLGSLLAVAACAPQGPDTSEGGAPLTTSTALNGPMNAALNAPLNAPLNGPMNAPLTTPLNSSLYDANNRPQDNGLGDAISRALASDPAVRVMIAADARTTPGQIGDPGLVLSEGVDQLGISLAGDNLPSALTNHTGENLAGSSLSVSTLGEIASFCPFTSFADYTLPDQHADKVDLYLPKMTVIDRGSLVDLTPDGVGALGGGIDTDADGTRETDWHVFVGTMLLCDDLMTNVVFLGTPWSGTWHGGTVSNKVRPYETDLQYVCVKTSDLASPDNPDVGPKWWCLRGVIGEGELGFALHSPPTPPQGQSPGSRPFYTKEVAWHANHWNGFFLFGQSLEPIVTRPPDGQAVVTSDRWWNLNPNDHAPDTAAAIERHKQFLAAVAVKTTTGRDGLLISPYPVSGGPAAGGDLGRCEDVGPAPERSAGFPATPCTLYAACAASEIGPDRDCSWATDEVYGCNPGDVVVVGAGANAVDCARPLGTGPGDTILRVCAGTLGCAHDSADNLGEGDHQCGTNPSVAITCPASGTFAVMKATGDSAAMDGHAWDAPGGGVPGVVGVSANAQPGPAGVITTTSGLCPAGASGEARDCGWAIYGSYVCNPGTAVSFGVHDPATCAKIGGTHAGQDVMIRICDGRSACTWSSVKRLGHNDNRCGTVDPTATFTCGLSGEFTAMYAAYRSDAAVTRPRLLVPVVTADNGVRASTTFHTGPHVDVASSGDLQDDLLIHIAIPRDIEPAAGSHPRACDWGSNWGLHEVAPAHVAGTSCYVQDLDSFHFRVAANFDADSTWTRCPSHEPAIDGSCTASDARKTYVTVKGPAGGSAFLVPVGGARFESLGGMTDTPLPDLTSAGTATCGGVPCCVASPGAVARCVFQTACTGGLTFEVRVGDEFASAVRAAPGAVGWSFQDSRFSIATVVSNHDWAFTADLRSDVAGNFKCEPRDHENAINDPADCAQKPHCDLDGVCEPGETGDICPTDCVNPNLGDLTALFAEYANLPDPPPLPSPPPPDTTPPCVNLLASGECEASAAVTVGASSPEGATVVYDAVAVDEVDGQVPVHCAPLSGATFAPGVTTVHCFAADTAGNAAQATIQVTVVDTVINQHPDLVRAATGANGARVIYGSPLGHHTYIDPDAPGMHADACAAALPPRDGTTSPAAVTCTPASGSVFPIGVTTVSCTASPPEPPGATHSTSFTVTVR